MTSRFPTSLNVALKEWDIVCQALGTGRQMILLRKGGISEGIGGFEIEHRRFLLFPTFLHQNLAMLKPGDGAGFVAHAMEPEEIILRDAAEIVDIVQLKSRQQMDRLDAEHIWAPPLIDMRFGYRPKNPLYLLIIRTYRLSEPARVRNLPEYAGCKSWVPLEESIEFEATPVIDDAAFAERRDVILNRL